VEKSGGYYCGRAEKDAAAEERRFASGRNVTFVI